MKRFCKISVILSLVFVLFLCSAVPVFAVSFTTDSIALKALANEFYDDVHGSGGNNHYTIRYYLVPVLQKLDAWLTNYTSPSGSGSVDLSAIESKLDSLLSALVTPYSDDELGTLADSPSISPFTAQQAKDITTNIISGSSSGSLKWYLAEIYNKGYSSTGYTALLPNINNVLNRRMTDLSYLFTGRTMNVNASSPSLNGDLALLPQLTKINRALYGSHNLEGADYEGIGAYLDYIYMNMQSVDEKLSYNDVSAAEYLSRLADFPLLQFRKINNGYLNSESGGAGSLSVLADYPVVPGPPVIPPSLPGYEVRSTLIDSLPYALQTINDNIVASSWGITSGLPFTLKSFVVSEDSLEVEDVGSASSFAEMVYFYLNNLSIIGDKFTALYFDEDELRAKELNKSVTQEVVSDFLSPGEGSSVSGSTVVQFKGSFDSLKNGLQSPASGSDAFSVLGSDSETYFWFSQNVADDLDSVDDVPELRTFESVTPALDRYYDDVFYGIHLFD